MRQQGLKILIYILLLFIYTACNPPSSGQSEQTITEDEQESFLKRFLLQPPEANKYPNDFDYLLLDGTKEKLAKNRGKVVFLNFWATWCVPCKKELPDMDELLSLMKNENFRMLAVSVGEDREVVEKFIKKFPYTFDIVVDEDNEISPKFDVMGLPTTFIFDLEGKVIAQATGPRKWNNKELVSFLRAISRK